MRKLHFIHVMIDIAANKLYSVKLAVFIQDKAAAIVDIDNIPVTKNGAVEKRLHIYHITQENKIRNLMPVHRNRILRLACKHHIACVIKPVGNDKTLLLPRPELICACPKALPTGCRIIISIGIYGAEENFLTNGAEVIFKLFKVPRQLPLGHGRRILQLRIHLFKVTPLKLKLNIEFFKKLFAELFKLSDGLIIELPVHIAIDFRSREQNHRKQDKNQYI